MLFSLSHIAKILSSSIKLEGDISIERVSTDTRNLVQPKAVAFIALVGEKYNGHQFVQKAYDKGVRVFIVSEPVSLPGDAVRLEVDNTLIALQQLASAFRKSFRGKVVAITGSNGKTIVKEWLYQVLSTVFVVDKSPLSYNSQVGVPLAILSQNPSADFHLIEVGISKPGEMQKLEALVKPDYGIFTHLGNAHLENFESKNQLLQEKSILFENVNTIISAKGISFNAIKSEVIYASASGNTALVKAAAVFLAPQLNLDELDKYIDSFSTLDHRLQLSHGKQGNIIVNDSYSLDFSGLQVALDFFVSQSKQLDKTLILSAYTSESEDLYKHTAQIIKEKGITKLIFVSTNSSLQKYFSAINEVHYFGSTDELLKSLESLNLNQADVLVKGARSYGFKRVVHGLEKMNHHTYLEINLQALGANIKAYQQFLGKETKLMAMIKASGYGGGLVETAKVLAHNNVDYLGVAYLQEGVELRQADVKLPIMVMNTTAEQLQQVVDHCLEASVYSIAFIKEVFAFAKNTKHIVCIHLKLDTGMNRLGVRPNELPSLLELLATIPKNVEVISIYSHLATADTPGEADFAQEQIAVFEKMSSEIVRVLDYPIQLKPLLHICNTKGIENFPKAHFSMVRLGIGLYGIESQIASHTVFSFRTSITKITEIKAGESVSYGRRFIASEDMKIAVLPVGYADGLPRRLGKTEYKVLINKQFYASIIGDICMDMLLIDVSNIPCEIGSWVEIFGENIPVDQVAKALDTIPYEVITHIGPRVRRVYIQE